MKAEDIVRQLIAVAPQYTDRISTQSSVSLEFSSGIVTGQTLAPHSLTVGQYISIFDALSPNLITSLTRDIAIKSITREGQVATVTTVDPHNLFGIKPMSLTISGADQPEYNVQVFVSAFNQTQFSYLVNGAPATPATGTISARLTDYAIATTAADTQLTEGYTDGVKQETPTVDIDGANEIDYNGTKELIRVVNPRKFIFKIAGNPASPATGTIYLREYNPYRGYNGRHQITSVPTTTTFTYAITDTPLSPAQGSPIMSFNERISRTIPFDRAQDAYTPQPTDDEYWVFVGLQPSDFSRMRETETDAGARISAGTEYRQLIIERFSVYVFAKAVNAITAAGIRDDMSDFRWVLYKSLLKFYPPSDPLSTPTFDSVTYEGDDMFFYNGAIYVHEFRFSCNVAITDGDCLIPRDSVAFRRVYIDYIGNSDYNGNMIIAQGSNKLDEDAE